jgi:lipopolysaccharide biosynthesis glycosyltransferase
MQATDVFGTVPSMHKPESAHAVVLAADSGFTMQLAVALVSLADQQSSAGGRPLDTYVLTSDIAVHDRRAVETSVRPVIDVHWVDVDQRFVSGLRMADYLPVSSAFRLLIGEVLPASVERAVYLDADVLVRHPIDELFTTDLQGAVMGGVPDAGHPWVATVHSLPWRTLGLDPSAAYFNAGVLAIDLARWRDEGIGRRAMELLRSHKFAYSDQCALNAVANGSFHTVETKFNVQADHFSPRDNGLVHVAMREIERIGAIHDPAIVHFCNGGLRPSRPWFLGSSHPFAEAWLAIRAKTPYGAVLLPDAPSPSKTTVARRRLRRAAYVLTRG